jgi:hypothetical protein
MRGMIESMRTMHSVLRGADPVAGAEALAAPLSRVAAYQRFIKAHIDSVLLKNYTTFAALVGEAVWREVIAEYFSRHPADDWELNASVRHFPGYVAELVRDRRFGLTLFHQELADFERREFEVFAAPVEIPAADALTAPTLNPTLQILQLRHPVGTFVRAFRAWESGCGEEPEVPAAPSPEILFLFRHPVSLRHTFAVANESLLFAFKITHDGVPIEEAAKLAGLRGSDVENTLWQAHEIGLLVVPEPQQQRVLAAEEEENHEELHLVGSAVCGPGV